MQQQAVRDQTSSNRRLDEQRMPQRREITLDEAIEQQQ